MMTYRMYDPIFEENFIRFISALQLPTGSKVIDIGCGNGQFLIALEKAYHIRGLGIDISRERIAEAMQNRQSECPRSQIDFINADANIYRLHEKGNYDVASCIGTWAGFSCDIGGMVHDRGIVIFGMPYWRKRPGFGYTILLGRQKSERSYRTLNETSRDFLKRGYTIQYLFTSSQQEYDHYQSMQWQGREKETPVESAQSRMLYLDWLREYHGWGIWVLAKQ